MEEVKALADKCDVYGCKVVGYSATVDADNRPYHFCSKHYEEWGKYLDSVEADGIIHVHTPQWTKTLEDFLMYEIISSHLDNQMIFRGTTIKAIVSDLSNAGYSRPVKIGDEEKKAIFEDGYKKGREDLRQGGYRDANVALDNIKKSAYFKPVEVGVGKNRATRMCLCIREDTFKEIEKHWNTLTPDHAGIAGEIKDIKKLADELICDGCYEKPNCELEKVYCTERTRVEVNLKFRYSKEG